MALRRPAYKPEEYAVPAKTLEGLRRINQVQTYEEALHGHEGTLLEYHELERFQRDGHTWALLQANFSEHCVEVEIVGDLIGRVEPVPPLRAWNLALAQDAKLRPGIVYE